MKRLFLIGGTMGVGKTTVCQQLKKDLPNSVLLDGDWCWDADPFQVTEETKGMVLDNICHVLNNFIHCTAYDTILFCWVMHEQDIIDTILKRLDTADCEIRCISLIADEQCITTRLTADILNGIRSPEAIRKSVARIPLYEGINTIKIDTTDRSVPAICAEIARL